MDMIFLFQTIFSRTCNITIWSAVLPYQESTYQCLLTSQFHMQWLVYRGKFCQHLLTSSLNKVLYCLPRQFCRGLQTSPFNKVLCSLSRQFLSGLLTPPFNRSVTFSILEVFAKELRGKFCQDLVSPTYPKENLKYYFYQWHRPRNWFIFPEHTRKNCSTEF